MKNLLLLVAFLAIGLSGQAQKFQKIFNGKDLTGWTINGTEKWYVEKGELVCESGPEKKYGYLSSNRSYKNFILELNFKLEANGNSGVFFRSSIEGVKISGWQVEVAPPDHHTGGIYESYGRGWLIKPNPAHEKYLKATDWNKMKIHVNGNHVTTWLNGHMMVDIDDEKIGRGKGFIALQIHDGGGIKVRWKNIKIKELPYTPSVRTLFDGKTFNGWHIYNKKGEVKGWTIEEGALVCHGTGGDLVTDAEYDNFELSWDWKITEGGNSGVMYHVIENEKYKAPYHTAPEYQLIDDIGFPGKLEEWQKAGADYAMNLPNDKKKLKPVGEWNTSKIVFNNGVVEHWLNGEKIIAFTRDANWEKAKRTGKWKDFPDYGSAKKGKIALQEHGNKVYFRNITLKEL
ncbi:MAG: DUF1080 domain-containing protein [Saprospiraceae bacterium]|nr:DUF1080 domain-containing protein [Saprospiraceae bacterium]